MQYTTVQCSVVQYSTTKYNAGQCTTVKHRAGQRSAVQYLKSVVPTHRCFLKSVNEFGQPEREIACEGGRESEKVRE